MFLFPDLSTYAVIPWKADTHKTARLICNVFTPDGERFIGAPRTALTIALEEAAQMGYEYRVGPELEFFLFETDESGTAVAGATHDEAGYFDATADRATLVRQDMMLALQSFGIEVEAGHHECAAGQHEIDFRYSNAITAADNAVTFKYVLKAIAHQHGLLRHLHCPNPFVASPDRHARPQSLAEIGSGATFLWISDRYEACPGRQAVSSPAIEARPRHVRPNGPR
jgi:glutamine synthetase